MIFQALEKSGNNQGKAAQALGISRRTLLRKLKTYRESADESPAGTLSLSQQRYYRAHLALPVKLKCGTEQFDGVLLNLSQGGAGVNSDKPLKTGGPITVSLTIPGTADGAELPGRVTWANKEGHHGIQFGELPASTRTTLQRFLARKCKKTDGNSAVGMIMSRFAPKPLESNFRGRSLNAPVAAARRVQRPRPYGCRSPDHPIADLQITRSPDPRSPYPAILFVR